jgi:hypothetical protein
MKKILFITLLMFLVSFSAFGQTQDEKDSLAVVNKMFTEMANHNPAAIAELYTKDSNLTAIIRRKDGKNSIMAFTGEAFSKNFSEKKNEIKEDMYAPEVKIYGDLAVIHGRYVFFVDGKISHCGVNAFHLVKTETGWKIANASSTIDPTACTEEEKNRKAN